MFASLAWIQIVGALIGNVTQNAVFSATVGWMQSFVFMVNASTYFLAALLTMFVIFHLCVQIFAHCYFFLQILQFSLWT